MARAGAGGAGRSRRAGGGGRRPTWEISDSDAEGPAGPREERRAAARPEQSLRRVAVRVDPALLGDAGVLLEALRALGCERHVEAQRPARSLRWSRAQPDPRPRAVSVLARAQGEEGHQWPCLLQPHRQADGLNPGLQTCRPAYSMPWACPESSTGLHLAVIGLDAYLQSHQPSSREVRQPEGPAVACAPVALSWPKVEEALVLLQLWAHLDVLLVPSWQELSQHVCTFTKAFSLPAFRQYRESCAFSFCMDGRWAAGEQVARDGTGLRGVWWRQIKQFNRVSPAVADAVVAAFPSPCLLQQVGPLHPPGVEPGVQDPPLLIPVPALGIHGLQHGAGAPGPPGGPPREGGRGVWPRRGWGLTSPVASTSS
uniref:ERCC4 domain-containing protein n=1 Tax=Canis lupus familiaris TaxID=9615 RepID=A0A8C0P826_CANLF